MAAVTEEGEREREKKKEEDLSDRGLKEKKNEKEQMEERQNGDMFRMTPHRMSEGNGPATCG